MKTSDLQATTDGPSLKQRGLVAKHPRPAAEYLVWPPPRHLAAAGPPIALAADGLKIRARFGGGSDPAPLASTRLAGAVRRYSALATRLTPTTAVPDTASISSFEILVRGGDGRLGLDTKYDYELSVSANGTARAVASSVYGAMYAMESFVQLIGPDGEVRHSTISIRDAPRYPWRGLMVDSG